MWVGLMEGVWPKGGHMVGVAYWRGRGLKGVAFVVM